MPVNPAQEMKAAQVRKRGNYPVASFAAFRGRNVVRVSALVFIFPL
jgi:hypothetical protein